MDGIVFVRKVESMLAAMGKAKEEFYRDSGITSAAMSQYRTGLYNPSKRTIAKVAAYFGTSIEKLTEKEQKETPPVPEGGGLDQLTAEQRLIIELYDSLDPVDRPALVATARALAAARKSQDKQ